jgi:hypothetical protein
MSMKCGRESTMIENQMCQGKVASCSPLHRPWLAWVAVDVTELCCLPRACLDVGLFKPRYGEHQKNERKHLLDRRHGLDRSWPPSDPHEKFAPTWDALCYCQLLVRIRGHPWARFSWVARSLPSPWPPLSCINSCAARRRPSRSASTNTYARLYACLLNSSVLVEILRW